MEKIKKYIEENKERFFEELFDFIGVAELTGEAGYTDLEKILGLKSVFQRFGH
ncbi:MAG: hypothetical protein Q7J06_08660 [Bacteroidales bacterium]|nr:hypothetical protein [Bacteroidales bacterium]